MQPLNNDMEELFREAADKYPLKTEGADWSKVQRRLQTAAKEEDDFRRKGGNRRYAWLLLLLLVPLICNRLTGGNSGNRAATDKTAIQISSSTPVKRGAATEPSSLKSGSSVNDNKIDNEPDNTITGYAGRSPVSGSSMAPPYIKPVSSYRTKPINNRIPKSGLSYERRNPAGKNEPFAGNKNSMLSQQNSTKSVTTDGVGSVHFADNSNLQKNSVVDSEAKGPDKRVLTAPDLLQVIVNEAVDSAIKRIEEQPAATDSTAAALKARRKKIYVTVLAGPDFSAVKSSHIQGMKGSVGVMAGYSFTRKFSVEAGMLWDDKKYASEGKYFNIDRANLPIHTTVLDISGTCHMIEVPLIIRYNFAAVRSHSWSVSTGISSYFMKKETYDYWYVRYNNKYYAEKEYENSGNDLFSMLQASAGYQKALGRSASLRIEPYLKVPLKGIGIGRIPLLSAGMYVGLTVPVH